MHDRKTLIKLSPIIVGVLEVVMTSSSPQILVSRSETRAASTLKHVTEVEISN